MLSASAESLGPCAHPEPTATLASTSARMKRSRMNPFPQETLPELHPLGCEEQLYRCPFSTGTKIPHKPQEFKREFPVKLRNFFPPPVFEHGEGNGAT